MSEIVRKKCEETCLNKYGVSNVSSLESTRKAVIETVQQKYGVNNVFQSNEFSKKRQSIHNENLDFRLAGLNLKFLYKKDERITLLCLNCNNTFSYAPAHFYRLLDSETKSFCPICSRIIESNSSLQEKSLLEYIKSIYTGKILENDRQALNGRELDIYLPEKKMAIEFDGTYWHADPRFYSADFMIMCKSASEIWKRDNEKNELCHTAGILLLRINEYDWLTNRQIMEDCVSRFISAVSR
jgi:G:T-mismatch repair DNA endonuclease (very short patch repair protein)